MSRSAGHRWWQLLLVPFEWLGIGLALLIFVALPRRALFACCDCCSRVYYVFDRRGRRLALANVRVIRGTCTGTEGTCRFDPDSAAYRPTRAEERLIRRAYRNMARTVGYAFWTCFRARQRAQATGLMDERARTFLKENRSVIAVSGHLGCWEILSQLALLEGHRMMSVAKRIGTGGMTALLMRARRSIGQEIVLAEGAFKPLMQGLRDGKSLGLLVDQRVSPKKGGVWIRFFGRPMAVSVAPAFFAAKVKVPIAVVWSRPLKDGRYRCETIDVIPVEEARNVWVTVQRCAKDLERIVRRHPSCWVLNYNFFCSRLRPEDLETLRQRETEAATA